MKVIHDQGGEFTGHAFQNGLNELGIQPVSITSKNPQANAVCERMHRTIKNMLRTMLLHDPPNNVGDAYDIIDTAFAKCMFAGRTAVHRTLGVSPGGLVFHRDMLLPLPVLADYEMIKQQRQTTIDQSAARANAKRNFRDYQIGDEVLVKTARPYSLQERAGGPYIVRATHVNGTVTIERSPNVLERINIRRIRPYYRA